MWSFRYGSAQIQDPFPPCESYVPRLVSAFLASWCQAGDRGRVSLRRIPMGPGIWLGWLMTSIGMTGEIQAIVECLWSSVDSFVCLLTQIAT